MHSNPLTLLTPDEVAAKLRIGRNTLAKWRVERADRLPFVKIGNRVVYRLQDVEAFVAAQLRRSTSDSGAHAGKAA